MILLPLWAQLTNADVDAIEARAQANLERIQANAAAYLKKHPEATTITIPQVNRTPKPTTDLTPLWTGEDLQKARSLPEPEKTAFKAELMARLLKELQ